MYLYREQQIKSLKRAAESLSANVWSTFRHTTHWRQSATATRWGGTNNASAAWELLGGLHITYKSPAAQNFHIPHKQFRSDQSGFIYKDPRRVHRATCEQSRQTFSSPCPDHQGFTLPLQDRVISKKEYPGLIASLLRRHRPPCGASEYVLGADPASEACRWRP